MSCNNQYEQVDLLQKRVLEKLPVFKGMCNDARCRVTYSMLLKIKQNESTVYSNKNDKYFELYSILHRYERLNRFTIKRQSVMSSVRSPGRSVRSPGRSVRSPGRSVRSPGRSVMSSVRSPGRTIKRRNMSVRHMMKGGVRQFLLKLIGTLLLLNGHVDETLAARGFTAKSLTKKQISSAFNDDEYKADSVFLALANTGGSCLPTSELAASAASGEDTYEIWKQHKSPEKIASELDELEVGDNDSFDNARYWIKTGAHTSDSALYGQPDTLNGFESWNEIINKTNVAADTIYDRWSTSVGGKTDKDICMYRFSVSSLSGNGHSVVGMVRKGSDNKLRHGYIDSNSFADLLTETKPWLYVEPGFFDRKESFELSGSVTVSEKPVLGFINTFGIGFLDATDPEFGRRTAFSEWWHGKEGEEFPASSIQFEYENNSEPISNAPTSPGDIFPPLRFSSSQYKKFKAMKDEVTWMTLEYASLAIENKNTTVDDYIIDESCKYNNRRNCSTYTLKHKSI